MKLVIDSAINQTLFRQFGEIITAPGQAINHTLVKDADILLVRSRTKVNEQLLKNSTVRFVGSAVSGTDHVDLNYLKEKNICFHDAKGCNANAVAEYVIATLLNLSQTMAINLNKQTLAIIGVGCVGRALAAKARQLGMSLLLNDPPRQINEKNKHFVDLKTCLTADIISLHVPLTTTGPFPTKNLINANLLSQLKDKIIINTARGDVIDEKAWQNTQCKANIIDCWSNEPHINVSLQKNAYLATPHIAGHSIDAKMTGSYIIYQALAKYLKQKTNVKLNTLIKTPKQIMAKDLLIDNLNQIYDFRQDHQYLIQNPNCFEHYRRHYPARYEWHHYPAFVPDFLMRNSKDLK